MVASTQTALNEDANFYGTSPTLNPALTAGLEAYGAAARRFIELTRAVAGAETQTVTQHAYVEAGIAARNASFAYWRTAVGEMDKLLTMRIADYDGRRVRALTLAAGALLLAMVISFLLMRSVTGPLDALSRSLAPGATLLGESVQRIAAAGKSKSTSPEEFEIICEELDSHCTEMRKAVAELVSHVSGSGAAEKA